MTASDFPPPTFGGAPPIWHNVPQRNKNFTGRTEVLERLREGMHNKVAVVLPQALQGFVGVGKTAVAIEYAHRYRADYDLICWIPADESVLVSSCSLAALAEYMGLRSAMATGIVGTASAVLDALRRGVPYNRWLLIFDNADQPEDLNEILPRGPGDVLITSRNHRWQGVVDIVQVDVFTRGESIEFLNKRVLKGLGALEADRLAEALGDLPLALNQAGALQAETGMSADEYLRLLGEQTTQLMNAGKSPEYPRSMTAAWKLSVATLALQLPPAVKLLRCCAFFGPEPIPRDLFRRVSHSTGMSTEITNLIADPILLSQAIAELGRLALIKIDGRTIQVHRLVQALLREEIDPAEHSSYRRDVQAILAAGAPRNTEDVALWPRYAALVPHVTSDALQLHLSTDPAVRDFALEIVRYLHHVGDNPTARHFAGRFIAQWTKDSGLADPHVIDAQRHLGDALRGLGLYEDAYVMTEATLERSRDVLGPNDPLTLALENSFGGDLRARGEFAAALEQDLKALRLHEEVFGEENVHTLRALYNLALDYGLNSKYEDARSLLERTFIARSEATKGVAPRDLLASLDALSWALRLCGYFTMARDAGEDAYNYGREMLGPEHYQTLRALINLSIAVRCVGDDYESALEMASAALDSCTQIFGEQHPDTLAAMVNLASVLRTIGRTGDAMRLAENVVQRCKSIYGNDHPYTYACAGNLATIRRQAGDAESARQLDEESLAGLDAKLGRDHDYSLTVAMNLATDLSALGDTAQARELGQDTLRRLGVLMGEDRPLTLGCASNLSLDLRAESASEDADRLAAGALDRYVERLGRGHPDVEAVAEGRRLTFGFDPAPI